MLDPRELPEWLRREAEITRAARRKARRCEVAFVALVTVLLGTALLLAANALADLLHQRDAADYQVLVP